MLTKKQKTVLGFVIDYQKKEGISPLIDEISKAINVSSSATTHQHLSALEERGLIKKEKGHSRSIEITDLGHRYPVKSTKTVSIKTKGQFVELSAIENTIVHGECIAEMRKIPSESIDLIIADPPYNLSKGNILNLTSGSLKGAGGSWKKVMADWDNYSLVDYMQFTEAWLKEAKRILKKTGSMWIFGTYHNIGIVNTLLQLLDVEIINEVVWYKRNAFPNLAGRRLTASHETLIWAHSGGEKSRKYKFNYDYSKEFYEASDNLKQPGKQMRTVWDIPNNKHREELAYGKHPTQKPLKVCNRIVELASDKNDVVLAPFSGSGTECIAALAKGRKYIGIESEIEYVELSRTRLKASIDKTKQVKLL